MAIVNNTRHVTVQGDLGLKAAGTPIYSFRGGKIRYNVRHGEPVAYLTTKGPIPVTVGAAEINDSNKHRIVFGVGHASDGTVVDGIRSIGAPVIGNCDIRDMSVASPACGQASVKDFYFDCVSCDETYTLEIGVRDNFTQSYTKSMKDYAQYWTSYVPNCKNCNDCDGTVDCGEIVDGLIDNLLQPNGRTLPDGRPYPDYLQANDDFPFAVHKVFTNSLTYCLSFEEPVDCEDCNRLTAFDSVTIGGTTYDLSDITTPTDDSAIFRSQLDQVVAIINDGFEEQGIGGSAYLTGVSYNQCCPLSLHVNTEDSDFTLTSQGDGTPATIEPKTSVNPFAEGESGEGYTCGIRVISAPLVGEKDCTIVKPLAMYARMVDIHSVGGFSKTKKVDIQDVVFPAQFGGLIQYEELEQDRGGSGRQYSGGHQVGTWLGGPRADAKVRNAITARADKDYCSYTIRSRYHFLNQANQEDMRIINSFIHVESDADTANASIKEFLDKWATLSTSCVDQPEIQCTPLNTTCE